MTDTQTQPISHVAVEVHGGVLIIRWNRPEKKNALTGAMYTAFYQGLERAEADPAIRAVLVVGAGGCFTSGNDLQDFASWGTVTDVEDVPVVRSVRRTVAFSKPLVAAVQGPSVGFGTTLLLHCDAVVAGPSATFALPFVRLGLVPEFGSTYLLPLLAGRARAGQLLLTGEAFGRDEAAAMGLVSLSTEEDQVEAQALALCERLAALPPGTVRTTKALIDGPGRRAALNASIDAELVAFTAALKSAEHAEAVAAFMGKRKPDFSQFS